MVLMYHHNDNNLLNTMIYQHPEIVVTRLKIILSLKMMLQWNMKLMKQKEKKVTTVIVMPLLLGHVLHVRHCHHVLVYHSAEVCVIEQDDEPAELEIDEKLSPYLVTRVNLKPLKTNEVVVIQYNTAASQSSSTAVIERTHNVLTRDEAIQNAELCRLALVKELNRWQKHGAWKRMALKDSHNLLRSEWVLKWKQINGKKDIKGRLVAQGFQDKQSLNTFSGTTSR